LVEKSKEKLKSEPLNQKYVVNEMNLCFRAILEMEDADLENYRTWVQENKNKLKVSQQQSSSSPSVSDKSSVRSIRNEESK
jgi:hypothetical protein